MSRKQRIIVSITGIVLVSLILIGLTYGYYMTKINGNTNSKSISVVTANLLLEYADVNDELITDSVVEPGKSWTKTFVATNKGNKTVTYGVALENVVNTLERKEDLVYTLECKQYSKTDFAIDKTNKTVSGTISGTCNGVSDETTFPTIGTILVENDIADDKAQVYTLVVTYKNVNENQNVDMNKTFSAKANIVDPSQFNPYVNAPLKDVIVDSAKIATGIDMDKTQFVEDTNCGYGTTCLANVAAGCPGTCVKDGTEVIYKTAKSTKIKTTPDLSKVADGTSWNDEVNDFTNDGIFSAEDDYGISYYYRGPILNNYVSFADKKWRIVRINGDGTIRLVLDSNAGVSVFNSKSDDNAYVGYMYGMTGQTSSSTNQCIKLNNAGTAAEVDTSITTNAACISAGGKWAATPYDATHINVVESTIKKALDAWYKTNIVDTNNIDYISDTVFCNDKTLASSGIGGVTTQLGYGTNHTYYASTERLLYSSGTTEITTAKPTFKCAENATNDYSRFTVDVATLVNGNKTNGDLKYPIGLLSADEVAYAGAYGYRSNTSTIKHYLSNGNEFMLSSPRFHGATSLFVVDSAGNFTNSYFNVTNSHNYRPVINLKAELLVGGGDGTSSNPYTVLTN